MPNFEEIEWNDEKREYWEQLRPEIPKATRWLRRRYPRQLNELEAEDLAEEAALEAALGYESERGRLESYYWTILKRSAATYMRKHGNQKCSRCEGGEITEPPCENLNCDSGWIPSGEVSEPFSGFEPEAPPEPEDESSPPAPEPSRPFEKSTEYWAWIEHHYPDTFRVLQKIARVLSPKERPVWWIEVWVKRGKRSREDVAEDLGMTCGAYRTNLSRARKKVSEITDQDTENGGVQ